MADMKNTDKNILNEKIDLSKNIVSILKDTFALLRDLSLFIFLALLILFPDRFNTILSSAGIVEGDFLGIKWKRQLDKSDSQLIEASQKIEKLSENLKKTNQTLNTIKESPLSTLNEAERQQINAQVSNNKTAVQQAESVNNNIQGVLESNAPFLNSNVNNEKASNAIINDYKIQIFYNASKPEQFKVANEIKSALKNAGITSKIEVNAAADKASSNQIRYFAQNERDVAYALQNLLGTVYPSINFKLQTVYTPSANSVSIFLKS